MQMNPMKMMSLQRRERVLVPTTDKSDDAFRSYISIPRFDWEI